MFLCLIDMVIRIRINVNLLKSVVNPLCVFFHFQNFFLHIMQKWNWGGNAIAQNCPQLFCPWLICTSTVLIMWLLKLNLFKQSRYSKFEETSLLFGKINLVWDKFWSNRWWLWKNCYYKLRNHIIILILLNTYETN